MAVNVQNAFIGRPPSDGGVYFNAPVGTALPADASEDLDALFRDHGAVGPEGIAVNQSRTTQDIKMFGGDTFIDVQTEYTETLTLTLLEDDNEAVLKTAFGDANVEVTPATSSAGTTKVIYHTSDPLPILSHVVDSVSGSKLKRYVVEQGRVSEVSEVKDVHDNVTSRTLTIKTFKPTSLALKGGNVVEYRDDGQPTP